MSLVVNRDWEYIVTPWVALRLPCCFWDRRKWAKFRSKQQAGDPHTHSLTDGRGRRRDDSPSLSEFKESRKKLVPKRKRCWRRLNRSGAIRSERAVIHSTHGRLSDVGISSATSLTDPQSPSPTPSPPFFNSLFLRVIVSRVTAIGTDRWRKAGEGRGRNKKWKSCESDCLFVTQIGRRERERESHGFAMNEENSQRR